MGEIVPQQQRAHAAGAQQPLVARYRHGTEAESLKVHREVSRRLGGVQCKGHALFRADAADSRRVLHRAADVGAVGHDDQSRILPEQPRQGVQLCKALGVTGNAADRHSRQAQQRPHDRVVLHAADDAVVAGTQKAGNDHIQPRRSTRRQNNVGRRLRETEQPRQPLPQRQRHQPRLLGGGIHGTVHVGSHAVQIVFHPVADPRRLGERRGGVVKINGLHAGTSSQLVTHHTTESDVCHGLDFSGTVSYNGIAILKKK